MAFADPEIIDVLNKIKYPYNINDITAGVVLNTLKDPGRKEELVEKIKQERRFLMAEIKKLPLVKEVLPSEANFFLARFDDPKAVYDLLTQDGIIVRNRSNQLHCEGCLRITVGTREENIMLIDSLKKISDKELL
jgi:histidinol-phosphate aminotransferase